MNPFWKIVGIGAFAVVVFDAIASLAARHWGFQYGYASVGSVLIYTAIGYFVFRSMSLGKALGAAMLVEGVDSSLGWLVSWKIGPGALPEWQTTAPMIAAVAFFAFLVAGVCAALGSGIARVVHGRRSPNA